MGYDERYLRRTLELAKLGHGRVSPNPLVGCVIVHNDKIIGEGWHRQYGEPHAEAEAIRQVLSVDHLPESTLYVNLEPCNHFGNTPPCTELIIRSGIKRVVFSNHDPNPKVAGKGQQRLSEAGIEVVSNVLQREGRQLNKRFFCAVEQNRPYITLKWAQTKDGLIARSDFTSQWISNMASRQRVHKMRSIEDAVLVGSKTALHDNPSLTVRLWSGRSPVRVVIDQKLKLPKNLTLFNDHNPTFVYNTLSSKEDRDVSYIKLDKENFLSNLLADLHKRNIASLLVEGGAFTTNEFIRQGYWDEAHVITSSQRFGIGIAAPKLSGTLISREQIDTDNWHIFLNENSRKLPS